MKPVDPIEVPQESLERKHEQRELSIRVLFVSLAILALLTAGAMVLMATLFGVLETREAARQAPPSPMVESDVTPPQPRLEVQSGEILRRLRALEDVQLSSYSWVDRDAGLARVPVERAMEILVERGWPARPVAAPLPEEQK